MLFQKFPVAKKFMDKRGGGGEGVSRCSVENFLSHSAENFRRGESFSVSLISGIEKLWIRGGSIKIFCRIFLSHSAEKLRSGTFLCCFRNFRYRKSSWIKGGGRESQDVPSKIFCLTVPKISVGGNPLVFQ